MGRKSKPNSKSAASDDAPSSDASRPSAAEAARRRQKGKGTPFPWMASAAVLVAAIGATVLLTRSPAPPAPNGAGRAAAAASSAAFVDKAFQPQDRSTQCASWVKDGECENNVEFMRERCPESCKALRKEKAAPPTPEPKKPTGPQDKNPNCGTWAASGECDANPTYMLAECPAACSGDPSEVEAQDIHQDCAAWVSDGECYRNPAFMLQQCKASCSKFAADNDAILQDTSDTCVNFALQGKCATEHKKASTQCRASCHIQRICANHTETVTCSKALRCEAIGDHKPDCAARAAQGKCYSEPMIMLKQCLKSCSEVDLSGMMRFHLPHVRTTLSPLIDLPYAPPRLAGFYQTPPQATNRDFSAKAVCSAVDGSERGEASGHAHGQHSPNSFAARIRKHRRNKLWRRRWSPYHWPQWELAPGRERTPRVPHRFTRVPDEEGSSRMVTVQHVSFSPRIRYLHHLLSEEECDHVLKVAQPLFSRSPVRGSVTRVRTSTTAMLGGRHDDVVVTRIRNRIARFSGYDVSLLEPLQVVRYERGQKYEGHHDFFDVCDVEDKVHNGRRQVTFLIYLVGMPEGEDGGGTRFPELQLEVAPQKGSAVVFNDCFDNGEEDGRSLHAGQPPKLPNTVKYAINGWIRSSPVYSKMSSVFG